MRPNSRNAAAGIIGSAIKAAVRDIEREVKSRSYRASNHLRTASLFVLRGQRGGRRYRVPGTRQSYQASAPGESPANRTGIFRLSWRTRVRVERQGNKFRAIASIESGLRVGKWNLGELLEGGTRRMKPRPYKQAVRDRAMPEIEALYRGDFNSRME